MFASVSCWTHSFSFWPTSSLGFITISFLILRRPTAPLLRSPRQQNESPHLAAACLQPQPTSSIQNSCLRTYRTNARCDATFQKYKLYVVSRTFSDPLYVLGDDTSDVALADGKPQIHTRSRIHHQSEIKLIWTPQKRGYLRKLLQHHSYIFFRPIKMI